jgi:hypothetical protein
MEKNLKAIVEATILSFKRNKIMSIDLERLRKAERVGPGRVKEMRSKNSSGN